MRVLFHERIDLSVIMDMDMILKNSICFYSVLQLILVSLSSRFLSKMVGSNIFSTLGHRLSLGTSPEL